MSLCIVYVKEVASLQGLGQLMGVAHKRMHAELQTSRKKCKTLLITNLK